VCMSTGETRLFVLAPELLEACAARHTRLCPRQVLGLRMGLLGAKTLGLDVPRPDKRLLVIAETDGCMADGLITATGCSVGRRTLRIVDYGKVAATFVDVETGRALRVSPRDGSRGAARDYAPEAENRWRAQLDGYKVMPDDELLSVQEVTLTFSLQALIGTEGYRVTCDACGEEIINQREVRVGERVLCRSCAGRTYYALPASAKLPLGKLTVVANPILGDP
jgi:formylmethanofuran dehydrogenase subunit E